MTVSRRKFLQTSGLASASMMLPNFLKAFQNSSPIDGNKILVVIQLSGGNDGLNTVIPFRNDVYYKSRPVIGIGADQVLKLNDEMGLNPVMTKMADMHHNGTLAVLNNVGYPNPDRSHFRAMDIWQTASGSDKIYSTGWLGRYLDSQCSGCEKPYHAIEVDDMLSLAMKGEMKNGIAMSTPQSLLAAANDPFFKKIVAAEPESVANDNLHYLYKTAVQTEASAEYIYQFSKVYRSSTEYPQSEFGNHLKTVAELIVSGLETRVYYVSLGSFDTHSNQINQQTKLLQQLSDGLNSFTQDLKANNRMNDVLVFTFSEFGRRVEQNASGGTDHGTANNIFLIGGNLKKQGILNDTPDLSDLDEGDLKFRMDFRQLYATVINKWLGADDAKILGQKFDYLDIV